MSRHLSASSLFGDAQPATPTTARPIMPTAQISANSNSHRSHGSSNSKSLSISVPRSDAYTGGEKTAVAAARAPLAGFPSIEEALLVAGTGIDQKVAFGFWQRYASHCHALLESVRAYRFEWVNFSFGRVGRSLTRIRRASQPV